MTTIAEAFVTLRPDASKFGQETEQEIGRSLTAITGSLLAAGSTLTAGVTAPIVGMGAVALKSAMTFESAFTGVIKVIDATDHEIAGLRSGILDMSKELPASAAEISEVAMAAGQLGIAVPNILEFTRVMIDLGESTNLHATEAAMQLARFANITQMSQQDFDRLGSSVVALGNNLATTEAEIVSFGLRIAGAGAQIGLSEAQILAWGAALSEVGINAEAGGTAISRVFIDIANAVSNGGEDVAQFARIAGMSVAEFAKTFRTDASEAVIRFVEGLGAAADAGENVFAILDDLSFGNIRVRDALLRSAGAGDRLRQALEIGTEAWEENTALVREAELRYGTAESRLAMLKNEIQAAAIVLGDALVPMMLGLVDAVSAVVPHVETAARVFAALPTPVQFVVAGFAALVAAAGPVLFMIGGMAAGFSALATFIGVATGAMVSLNLAMLANPVTAGLVVAGLAVGAVAFGTIKGAIDEASESAARYARIQEIIAASNIEGVRQELEERQRLRFALLEQVGAMEAAGITTFEHERQLSRLFERIALTEGEIGDLKEALAELERQERITAQQSEEVQRILDEMGAGAIGAANDLAKLTPQMVAAGVAARVMRLWMSETLPPLAGMALGFNALVVGVRQVQQVAEMQAGLTGLTNAILGVAGVTDAYERSARGAAGATGGLTASQREAEQAAKDLAKAQEQAARAAEQAAAAAAQALDALRQQSARNLDQLGRQIVTALQRQHQQELDSRLAVVEAERIALQGAHDRRMAMLQAERDAAVAAIDEQLAALDRLDAGDRLSELQRQLALAWDPREQKRIQEQITALGREAERQRLRDARTAADTRLRDRQRAIEDEHRAQVAALDRQVDAARRDYGRITEAWRLESRARELVAAGELGTISALIEQHVPEWASSWQSFADSVIHGPLTDIERKVRSVFALMSSVGGGTVGGGGVAGPSSAMQAAIDEMARAKAAGGVGALRLPGLRQMFEQQFGMPAPLAAGGIITRPTFALLGETAKARPEIVTPEHLMRRIVREETGGGGGQVIEVHTHTYLDGRHIDERIERVTAQAVGRGRYGA